PSPVSRPRPHSFRSPCIAEYETRRRCQYFPEQQAACFYRRAPTYLRKAGTREKKMVGKPLLSSCFPDSFCLSFVDDQLVPVRIAKLCHPANRRLSFLDVEGDTALFELRDGSIDVIHLEGDCRSIARRFPRGMTTNSDRCGAQIILDPRAVHLSGSRFELEDLLIKFSRAFLVRYGDSNEGYFVCDH